MYDNRRERRKPTFASCALPPMLPPAEPGPRTSDRLSYVSELTLLGDGDLGKELVNAGKYSTVTMQSYAVYCRP